MMPSQFQVNFVTADVWTRAGKQCACEVRKKPESFFRCPVVTTRNIISHIICYTVQRCWPRILNIIETMTQLKFNLTFQYFRCLLSQVSANISQSYVRKMQFCIKTGRYFVPIPCLGFEGKNFT